MTQPEPVAWDFGAGLHGRYHAPPQPRAAVLLTHGLGEHLGRYAALISALNVAGYGVYAYDQRGHGHSGGVRSLIRVPDLVEDHIRARAELRERVGALPVFAFGHSLGGLITALSVLQDPRGLRGVVLSSPALLIGQEMHPAMRSLSHLVGRLFPALPAAAMPVAGLSRDPETARLYQSDPLVYQGKVRAGTGSSMMRASEKLWARLDRWRLPTLIVQGDQDQLVSVEGARRFARGIASADQTYVEVGGGYHELFNDTVKDQMTATLTGWLDERSA